MSGNVVVVGGGIAGLTAAIYLARAGRTVTLFERKRHLGGRAITHLRHGFRFNLGPHALSRGGLGARIYRELGIPIRGGAPKRSGVAILGGESHRLPVSALSLMTTSLLSPRGKLEAARFLLRLPGLRTEDFATMTISDWVDAKIRDVRLREVIRALCRVVTYSGAPHQSAAVALEQLKLSLRGVIYIDEGWQKIVDALQSHAISAGVNFVTSARVIGVDHDDAVRAIRIGGLDDEGADARKGTRLEAENVILAVGPRVAGRLIADEGLASRWASAGPVTVACLDVALSALPRPRPVFVVGIDTPLYLSVHSAYAQLTPRGGALVHVAKYRDGKATPDMAAEDEDDEISDRNLSAEARNDELELEAMLDDAQPGWRKLVVHRRFLPAMTVAHGLCPARLERPAVSTPIRGLYLAGDWVGPEGLLADAALASARTAAQTILEPQMRPHT